MSLQMFKGYMIVFQLVAILGQLFQSKYPPFSPDSFNAIILLGYLLFCPLWITLYIHAYMLS